MKVMKKSFPYRIKGALISVLGAGIMGAACSKTEPQHDTTYTFGRSDWSQLENLDQIRRSADSTQVRNIIFMVSNEEWQGHRMDIFIGYALQPAFDAAKGKGVGRGTFKKVSDRDYIRAVEPQYNALGYKFTYDSQNQR